jgi:hypothetical protein
LGVTKSARAWNSKMFDSNYTDDRTLLEAIQEVENYARLGVKNVEDCMV